MAKKSSKPRERENLSVKIRTQVLTEAGYRCAVPTCREILVLDLHHIWEVSAGGPDKVENLIALCPTCHALYHRGKIKSDSIYAWKAMLVAIGRAFDVDAIDKLVFLHKLPTQPLAVSGDGVLSFARLIAADLAAFEELANNNWQIVSYSVTLTPKGRMLVDAWQSGDRMELEKVLAPQLPADSSSGGTTTAGTT
jgi:hypothetical protein